MGRRRRGGAPGRGVARPVVRRGLRQGRGGCGDPRAHRRRLQRRRQERRVPAQGRGARQRLHRPAEQFARLCHRQEHRHHAGRADRGRRGHRR
nr:hypothetical protein [Streptomyces noursei]